MPIDGNRKVGDASALVAMLIDSGTDGQWATEQFRDADLAGPDIVRYETANIVRRHELAGLITADQAAQAHRDLLDLPVESWPYEVVADRAWQLRHNLSTYDASYVAVAELLDLTLVTLDHRISHAPGVRCPVATPDGAT
jgi:predicted nucleic acid-binding protein